MSSVEILKFEHWAIVEIMGHQTYAGFLSEITIAGTVMLQINIPESGGNPSHTKIFGGGAIYGITPTTEEVVVRWLANNSKPAIDPWHIRQPSHVALSDKPYAESVTEFDDDDEDNHPY